MNKNPTMKELLKEWRQGLLTELHESYPRNEWTHDSSGGEKHSFGQWGDLQLSVKYHEYGYQQGYIWLVSVSTEYSGGGQTSDSIHKFLDIRGNIYSYRGSTWDLKTPDLQTRGCEFDDYDHAFKAADKYLKEWLAENSPEESQGNIDARKRHDDYYSGGKDGYTRT